MTGDGIGSRGIWVINRLILACWLVDGHDDIAVVLVLGARLRAILRRDDGTIRDLSKGDMLKFISVRDVREHLAEFRAERRAAVVVHVFDILLHRTVRAAQLAS